jgi:hypothetical protein
MKLEYKLKKSSWFLREVNLSQSITFTTTKLAWIDEFEIELFLGSSQRLI